MGLGLREGEGVEEGWETELRGREKRMVREVSRDNVEERKMGLERK